MRKYEPQSRRGQFQLSAELAAALREHDWPGNVRELANFIRRALALTHSSTLGIELFSSVAKRTTANSNDAPKPGVTLQDVERQLLEATLAATNGNRTRTAEMMGLSLRTIRNKIREYGLAPREAV